MATGFSPWKISRPLSAGECARFAALAAELNARAWLAISEKLRELGLLTSLDGVMYEKPPESGTVSNSGQPSSSRPLDDFTRMPILVSAVMFIRPATAGSTILLELSEAQTGVRFTQPVLDTLLLSAVVHRNQQDHSLEAIAERLGVAVIGRHTALGDALVTGEIFLKLVALLADRGIATLGQALDASRETYSVRLQY